ncbi:toll-like receptor 2 [Orbicella faveolata]|uniref:toll-like receptor 2 n=1 Tax=Orbicella faveolata TaxID=48498 RepID=UPI0009E618D4|nr:toll-like receptor 2 [Orbicella faveolata]
MHTGKPTSSTLTSTTGKPTSSTLSQTTAIPTSSTLSQTTASESGGLDSSSSSPGPSTTSFGTSDYTATNKTSSPDHTIKYVFIATVSGILVGLLLVLGFLKCMFLYIRRSRGRFPVPSGFDYHALIIFSSKDSEWVKKKLLRPLEEQHHFKCCIHYRDFDPGSIFLETMAESVQKSFKIIAVYSKDFQESNYCQHELHLAEYRQVTQGDDCLVIIRIDEAELDNLPPGLRGRSVIDYSKTVERPFWMNRLLQFLQVPEDSGNRDAVTGQERDTNNRMYSRMERRIRNSFVRLNSTSSNGSAVSFV